MRTRDTGLVARGGDRRAPVLLLNHQQNHIVPPLRISTLPSWASFHVAPVSLLYERSSQNRARFSLIRPRPPRLQGIVPDSSSPAKTTCQHSSEPTWAPQPRPDTTRDSLGINVVNLFRSSLKRLHCPTCPLVSRPTNRSQHIDLLSLYHPVTPLQHLNLLDHSAISVAYIILPSPNCCAFPLSLSTVFLRVTYNACYSLLQLTCLHRQLTRNRSSIAR